MSDVSKIIAMFNQKNNNNPNNINNNIKKNNDNKNKFKNESLKSAESKDIKNTSNNNNNQKNNKFQNKLSIFQTKENNNETNKKLEINKKETEDKSKNNISTNNIKEKEKEKEPQAIPKVNEPKTNFSDKLNFFNKKENESKFLDKSKTFAINNNKDNDSKHSFFIFIKENEKKHISGKINIFSNLSKSNKKEKETKEFITEKKNIFDNNKKENKPKRMSTDYEYHPSKAKNENHNNNNVHKIIEQLNHPKNDKNNNEFNPLLRNSTVINYNVGNKLNNTSNNNTNNNNINKNDNNANKNINNNNTNNNNINNEQISNLNINKIQEEKNNQFNTNNKSSKNVMFTPPMIKKVSTKMPINFNMNNNDKEIIPEIFLKSKNISENVINDTFCIGFFIASFNTNNPQLIENSRELCSDCGHNLCSSSLAIKPEIIFRYPQKDGNDFEISELGASICFPNGIKICCVKYEMHAKTLKNYSSILTNQNGKRYYMVTYHYYNKLPSKEFNTNSDFCNAIDTEIKNCIINNEYIYIPSCICLLSKYPYFNQIDKCLECMRFSLENYNSNPSEIYNLITYFIKSIPIPPIGTKLFFPLPYYSEIISLNQPFYKDVILFGDNPVILLEYLSVEEITIIFRLLLFEQKILIVGNNYDAITQFTYNFTLLLYPLQWVHTYISIMTEKMLKYLQSFLPFFNGMHISLYELTSNILESIKENIFIIDINKHTFEMNTYPNLNTKNVIKKINEIVPQLPKNIYNYITFGLGILKSYYDKKKDPKNFNIYNMDEMIPLNIKIKQVFIQVFIEILYDYKNYLTVIGGKPIFNTNSLLEQRPKNESNFYKELTQTQLFQMFIQNNSNTNKKNDTFFEEQLDTYSKCNVKTDFREEFINNTNLSCDIYKHYCIKYDDLEDFDLKNAKKINIKNEEEMELKDYKKYVKQKYLKYDSFFKINAIRNFNKRVIKNNIILEHCEIPSRYNFYIIPNQEFNFEVEKRKKSIRIKNENINSSLFKKGELTQEEKDDIKENISDVLTKIFKNEEISDIEDNKKLVMDSIKTDFGKELYTNILFQNSNILNESSFQFLKNLIYDSINNKILKIKSEEKQILYCTRLMKSCQNFRKEENKKFIYLSDVLFPKFQKIPLLTKIKFWKQWAELLVKEQKDSKKLDDDKWIDSLKNIEIIMKKMGFGNNKTLIYSTIADLAKENIHDESKFLRYMKEVVDNLGIFKRF